MKVIDTKTTYSLCFWLNTITLLGSILLILLPKEGFSFQSFEFSSSSKIPAAIVQYLGYSDYTRVDGALLGISVPVLFQNNVFPKLTGSIGYGAASKRWQYHMAIEQSFGKLRMPTVYASLYDETASYDDAISKGENILSTLLVNRDYRDYLKMRGGEVRFTDKFGSQFGFSYTFRYRKYFSLIGKEPWSLFYRNRIFRQNPPIQNGIETLILITITYDNRENFFIETNSWYGEISFEHEMRDYKFTGVHFAIQRIQLGYGNQTLMVNCRGDFRKRTSAEQFLFDLGGIGTLRGYNFKEYTGNNRLQLTADYLFNGDFIPPGSLKSVPILSSFSTGLFFEAGSAWFSDDVRHQLFPPIETGSRLRDIKTDAGISLFVFGKLLRIDIARRLDKNFDKSDWKFSLRFQPLQK